MRGLELLIFHEGERPEPYKDSLGYWTIGVGHLIDARKGATLAGVSIPLTKAQSRVLLLDDLAGVESELARALPFYRQLDDVRKHVLLEMVFNLGIEPFDADGIKDWPIFMRQLVAKDWAAAAANMRSTLWARQVGARAQRLAKMIETGQWPNEPGVPRIA